MPLNDILRASGVGRIDLMSVDVEHQERNGERRAGGDGKWLESLEVGARPG